MSARISRDLENQVDSSDGNDVVEVVLELRRNSPVELGLTRNSNSRSEAMDALKLAFETVCSRLEKEIEETGGAVIDRAWINQTIRARLPARAILKLADREDVAVIDVPHKIEPESA